MNFFGPYLDMWKNYANFGGRTTVRGYWLAVIVNLIVSTIISFIGIEILSGIYGLAILIPGLAICVRRLRDAGFHWTALLLYFIPLVGWIILIVKLCRASK